MPAPLFKKAQDQAEGGGGEVATTAQEGFWVNTDPAARGIAQAVVGRGAGGLGVRVFGFGDAGLIDWGEVSVDAVYATAPDSRAGVAFTTRYDFPHVGIELHTNLSKGLLILASLTTYRDGSGRNDYFAREFFREAEVEGPASHWRGGPEGPAMPGA